MKTLPIIEQHFHGAYGVDFNKAGVNEIVELSYKLRERGIGGFFPTLVTDTIENTKKQISVIKEASEKCDGILGIHLEGIFLNPLKKGIHNVEHFLALTVENYKKLEDEFIKIVTLAPELDKGLIKYLKSLGIKVQAGHCVGWADGENKPDGATHMYNAMAGISHKTESTALSAILDDSVYTEVIGDGVHVNDNALKLLLRAKPVDKVLLVSDSLPLTNSKLNECIFADSRIFYDGNKARSIDGTIAGSTNLLPDIIKILGKKQLFNPKFIENTYKYHKIEPKGEIIWDENYNIVEKNF
jgi:N-acetylglucosamine-6-phosphate deacetylase